MSTVATYPDRPARIYFFFSVLEDLFARVAVELQEQGALGAIAGCIWGSRSKDILRNCGIGLEDGLVLSEVYSHLPKSPDYEYIRSWENTSDPVTGPLIVTADRIVCSKPYDVGMAHLEAAFRAVEAAFDRFRPDALIMDDVSCIASYAHFLVARRRNLPTLMFGPSRLQGRAVTYSNQFAIFDETNAEYERIQVQGLGEEEQTAVRKYIADFCSNNLPPPYMGYMGRKPGLRWADLRVLATLGYWNSRDKMDYTLVSPTRAIGNRLTRIVRAQLYRPLWEQPVKDERYVLFPLHYQPEASTSVRAPFVLDQCALVENIARALPAGYRLYVKEHTARLGNKPLRDLHRLRAIPAVRLIHPTANIRELIKRAACIATITSTTGWEALLNGVPVVVFGRVFYEKCSNVHVAGSPYEYPKVFRRALSSRPQPRATEDFVAALLRTSFLGAHGHPYYLPEVLDPKNIKSIAGHFAKKLSIRTSAAL